MSRIVILKSNGHWSKPVVGLDKVYIIERAIECEFLKLFDDWKKSHVHSKFEDICDIHGLDVECLEAEEDSFYGYDDYLPELEINTKYIQKRYINSNSTEDKCVNWEYFKEKTGIDITKTKLLRLRLSTLQEIGKKVGYLSAIFDELIRLAELPTPVPTDYCVTLKFFAE